ncbi:hypothetical protein [Streptomyces violascens]|uniref:hypothetical protein n=1 Tax=Streptomyces violascens TaxID=67381 RepID=UPI00365CD069
MPRPCEVPRGAATTPFCALSSGQVAEHTEFLVTTDWLTDAEIHGGRLRARLAERVLPLGGLV